MKDRLDTATVFSAETCIKLYKDISWGICPAIAMTSTICFFQVKEANKLLKTLPHGDGKKKVEGVPVFSAQNLDIAIARKDGIKW